MYMLSVSFTLLLIFVQKVNTNKLSLYNIPPFTLQCTLNMSIIINIICYKKIVGIVYLFILLMI